MKPPQGPPLITHPPEQEPIVSFEVFSSRNPLPWYNNLATFFSTGLGEYYREEKEVYKRFASDYPDMAASLCQRIQNWNQQEELSEFLKPFDVELYEVYKIMRGYGFSDDDIVR